VIRLGLLLSFVWAGASFAQDDPRIELQRFVLGNIQEAYCSETQKCAPATAQELASPPLSLDLMTNIGQAALFSASVYNCGGDYEGSVFRPFMAALRALDALSERELALVSLLHGFQFQELAKRQDTVCSDALRQNLERQGLL